MNLESELKIGGFCLPPFSAKQCRQTITCVDFSHKKRTIDGELIQLRPSIKKYKSIITGRDKNSFGNFINHNVRVECIQRFFELVPKDNSKFEFMRPHVKGSVFVLKDGPLGNFDEKIEFEECDKGIKIVSSIDTKNNVAIDTKNNVAIIDVKNNTTTESLWVSYRPILDMVIVSYDLTTEEWGFDNDCNAQCSWKLELEEI